MSFSLSVSCSNSFSKSLSLSTFLISQGRTKVYVGLSFCLTVRDGCSALWVTESSCVLGSVCVSVVVTVCRNVCVCVHGSAWQCCTALQVLGACCPVSCHFDGSASLSSCCLIYAHTNSHGYTVPQSLNSRMLSVTFNYEFMKALRELVLPHRAL